MCANKPYNLVQMLLITVVPSCSTKAEFCKILIAPSRGASLEQILLLKYVKTP